MATLQFIPAFVHDNGHVCAWFNPVPASSVAEANGFSVMNQHGPNGKMKIIGIQVGTARAIVEAGEARDRARAALHTGQAGIAQPIVKKSDK